MSTSAGPLSTSQRASGNALNVALWIAQVLLCVAFGIAGVMKSTMPIEQLSTSMAWVPRFSPAIIRFIGVSELCGAVGVLLPSLTRIGPALTPLAALGLGAVMILAAGHHAINKELAVIPIPLFLGALAAFVGWGRWKKVPIAARTR